MLHQSLLRAALLVAAAIVAAGSAGAYSLGAGPSRLELTVEPGRTVKGQYVVSGEFEGVTTIGAYVADWEMGPDGEAVFLPSAGRHPRSLARWLQVSPAKFQLDRNGKVQIVQYRLTLPPGSAGACWGAVFFRDIRPSGGNPSPASMPSVRWPR